MLLMGSAAEAAPDLAGTWSGGRHVLTVSETGARLETDCAMGEFARPKPDAEGRFRVTGSYHREDGGPQPAPDKPATGTPATLEGQLRDGGLDLVLTVTGSPPAKLGLKRGMHIKLIRCL
jgi:hypothetical protein